MKWCKVITGLDAKASSVIIHNLYELLQINTPELKNLSASSLPVLIGYLLMFESFGEMFLMCVPSLIVWIYLHFCYHTSAVSHAALASVLFNATF